MTEKELIQNLKALRNTPEGGMTEERAKQRIFQVFMARIESNPIKPTGPVSLISLIPHLISPRVSYGFAAIALIFLSFGAAMASQSALPGQPLYEAKLAVEATQARLVSNPAQRAKVQMEFAGKRLRELEQVAQHGNGRSEKVLQQFSKDVKQAQAALKQVSDPLQVQEARAAMLKKAREYEEKLRQVKFKPGREVGVAALQQAEQALGEMVVEGQEGEDDEEVSL